MGKSKLKKKELFERWIKSFWEEPSFIFVELKEIVESKITNKCV
jgi:hypothetical protein